jgi:hypothetical protein
LTHYTGKKPVMHEEPLIDAHCYLYSKHYALSVPKIHGTDNVTLINETAYYMIQKSGIKRGMILVLYFP